MRPLRLLALPLALAACTDAAPPPAPDATTDVAPDAAADVAPDTAPTPDAAKPPVRDLPAAPPPTTVVAEPGVRRDVLLVPTPAAVRNPTTQAATPTEFDRVQVLRYRADTATPTPARAVLVMVPGFLGGGGSFDPLARSLVRRSVAANSPVEVWALDRRSNLLEDLRGMHAAAAARDPEVAAGYYLRQDVSVGGQRFEGFRGASDPALSYMAEWGLATLVNDLRAVVARVPESRQHAVLVGHSLGASIVEAYAAWDFDGTAGYRSIAGLAMIDGVAGGTSVTEMQWRMGGGGGPVGLGNVGVDALRRTGPWFVALPFIGVKALAVSEIVARRAALAPDAVVADNDRDALFRILLSVPRVPPLTNAAAMGFAFDESACPLGFARMSVGAPIGPLMRGPNPFDPMEMLSAPSSATETYRWTDAATVMPREFTPIANAVAAWTATPSNFSEWYFPTRLGLDVAALGNLSLAADAWQVREGIRATHGREVDVPLLGVATAFTARASAYDRARDRMAAAVGSDLPAAGAMRAMEAAYRAIAVPGMTHIDPLTAADDNPANPVPEARLSFATGATRGTVTPAP
jgi:hypothetical protein